MLLSLLDVSYKNVDSAVYAWWSYLISSRKSLSKAEVSFKVDLDATTFDIVVED